MYNHFDRTVEYTYDSLYRLTSETITEGEKVTVYTYAYDNVSNRILKTVNGEETVYTYNALNQLVSENDIVYEYDLNGNTVRMISPSKSALYVYNAENRLIRATVQSGNNVSVEEYKYDYAGNRIAKSSEGEYTKYLLDINGELTYVLAEMNYDGTEKCYYTRGDELISQERDGKKSYYVYDGHGSVRALADESGKVTDKYVYDAFGNLISSVGSTKNDFLFCGEQFDPVTGLYYLRARYMDTSTGRFISQDTYQGDINDPVSLHKYLYANANPVTYSDPSGYKSVAEMAVVGAAIGALTGIIVPNVLSMLKNLDMNGTAESTLSPVETIKYALQGMIIGALMGVMIAVGFAFLVVGISLFGGVSSAISGFNEYKSGNYRTAIAYSVLSILSFISAALLFNSTSGSQNIGNGMGTDDRPMNIVREINRGEKIVDLINELKALTFEDGIEYAVVKLNNGHRYIISGGETGIILKDVSVLYAHTHPFQFGATGPSTGDIDTLIALGQMFSYLIEHGDVYRFYGG